ncbi:hypothetical protein [Aliterella atlantica]|uniref:Uncharacterized protein n=1 Tax=Aliterella atlantica CENA595 TaxID=1618023 RepID=A0A0D8ZMW8_9CYAN|nr:hypothetical protein [Aliterella atlantica]KJH69794.1 hypothetical protein UH38_22045 [Aliterella atlantica CENA595]
MQQEVEQIITESPGDKMHNSEVIWAYAQGLTIFGFCPTEAEAIAKASEIEPVEHAGSMHKGYVLDLPPGSLEIEEDRVWFQRNEYPKPNWMSCQKIEQ